ncbi:hypothetical protein AWU18_13940, partial [Enterococcus faecium]
LIDKEPKNMRRTERAAYRSKFYSNLSSPTRFDEEPKKVTTVLCRSSFFRINGVQSADPRY